MGEVKKLDEPCLEIGLEYDWTCRLMKVDSAEMQFTILCIVVI
jgi:hypothetical protein